ncbi:MAG TPA: DsrE family protein [Thermomicrobiales bacterium]|nr:DsrE family protein [Thermomicrobiales bacterium]
MSKILIYGSYGNDDAERATLAFIVGNTALASDHEAVVFLTVEGVRLATKGYADDIHKEGFAPVKELIGQYVAGGGTLIACAACCKPRNIGEGDLIEGAEIAGAARLVEYLANGYAPFSA